MNLASASAPKAEAKKPAYSATRRRCVVTSSQSPLKPREWAKAGFVSTTTPPFSRFDLLDNTSPWSHLVKLWPPHFSSACRHR